MPEHIERTDIKPGRASTGIGALPQVSPFAHHGGSVGSVPQELVVDDEDEPAGYVSEGAADAQRRPRRSSLSLPEPG